MGFMRKIHWNPRFWDACATVHRFTDRYVQKALETEISDNPGMEKSSEKTQKKKYVFLSELAQQTSNPTELRDEILNILLAGRDTTASLLSNTFHVLALRPDIWSNLATEVEQLEGRRPTYETLNNMNYLRCLLNECKPLLSRAIPQTHLDTTITSLAPLPRRPRQRPLRPDRYDAPARRRPRRSLSHLYTRRHRDILLRLQHAPASCHFRSRRALIPA